MIRHLLIQGDARNLPLADNSVHQVVTSPPYWSQRDYGVPPSVWGGLPACEHDWGTPLKIHKGGPQGVSGERSDRDVSAQNAAQDTKAGRFCLKCGAWLGCLGLEPTPGLYVAHIVEIFREVRRVLRSDGTLWLNLGDAYANVGKHGGKTGGKHRAELHGNTSVGREKRDYGLKPKDLCNIPHRVVMALQADGWWHRDTIIWSKPNCMPSSVTDRCTTSHEYVFLLTKKRLYFYDADAIREPATSSGGASFGKQDHSAEGTGAQSRKLASPEERNHPLGRNKRSVWKISTQSFKGAHFATFPVKLVLPCIKAGTSEKGVCPTCGSPWKRVVERTRMEVRASARQTEHGNRTYCTGTMTKAPTAVTTHWLPTCKCPPADPIPATVLDPFSGAATTGMACLELGRSYVGVEPKFDYLEMSRARLAAWVPSVNRPKRKRPAPEPAQGTLWQ